MVNTPVQWNIESMLEPEKQQPYSRKPNWDDYFLLVQETDEKQIPEINKTCYLYGAYGKTVFP